MAVNHPHKIKIKSIDARTHFATFDPMNEIAANKIKTLMEIKTANYRAAGDSHPEVAAQFAVEAIVRMVMGQPKHIQQLLDEEIEDAIKAGRVAA